MGTTCRSSKSLQDNDLQKPCIECGRTLPLEEFYRHPMMADGHLNKCKACVIEYQRERYAKKVSTPEGLAAERERGREKYHRLYRDAARGFHSRWKEMDPVKRAANCAVNNAVRDGRLTKPEACSECGEKPGSKRIHGHHEDYSKPLEVEWLCSICHGQRHRLEI